MSLKKIHDDQPQDFKFSDENLKSQLEKMEIVMIDIFAE